MHVLYAQLDLGLPDVEIGELRQEADANHDGVVDWTEMVTVIEPLLAKFWRAKMAGAPIYEQWVQLHWEAHHTVKEERDTDGKTYMTKGDPFWVNKLSGESTWQKPAVLMEQEAIVARKKARAMQSAPGLEELLAGVIGVAGVRAGLARLAHHRLGRPARRRVRLAQRIRTGKSTGTGKKKNFARPHAFTKSVSRFLSQSTNALLLACSSSRVRRGACAETQKHLRRAQGS